MSSLTKAIEIQLSKATLGRICKNRDNFMTEFRYKNPNRYYKEELSLSKILSCSTQIPVYGWKGR